MLHAFINIFAKILVNVNTTLLKSRKSIQKIHTYIHILKSTYIQYIHILKSCMSWVNTYIHTYIHEKNLLSLSTGKNEAEVALQHAFLERFGFHANSYY